MTSPTAKPRRIAVIGGGMSGLAAAHRLVELDSAVDVTLLEAGDRLGGVIQTQRRDGFLMERSADMFTTIDPWALDLCRRIGIDDQLIGTNPAMRRAFIVHRGRLCPIPDGFTLMSPTRIGPVLTTPLLSLRGKLRLACEYLIPARKEKSDESLAAFVTRRLGREAYERIVQPLIGGIYTADPEKLSVTATMRQFVEMEQKHGSLIRGMRRRAAKAKGDHDASGARYSMFMTPRDGLSSLVEAIAARLPASCVRLNAVVERLTRLHDGKWQLSVGADTVDQFDAVIAATPAHRTASMLSQVDAELAAYLQKIPHAGAAIVVVAFRRDQIEHPLNGTGFVVPLVERRRILACSFSSVKFAGRAPDDSVLLRVFVGGACQPELVDLSDDELRQLVREELAELIGLRGEPLLCDITRWRKTMPQYHVGHLELVERIEQRAAALPNFQLAGNAYRGVGIPFCIHSGEQAAERLLGHSKPT
jgi:oxygen-dependent protoporphyrinogen oxidase